MCHTINSIALTLIWFCCILSSDDDAVLFNFPHGFISHLLTWCLSLTFFFFFLVVLCCVIGFLLCQIDYVFTHDWIDC